MFAKEIADVIMTEVDQMKEQVASLSPIKIIVNDMEVLVKLTLIFHMIDGKICNAVTSCATAQTCYLCGARSSDMKNERCILEKPVNCDILSLGPLPLPSWIRFCECILHISYQLDIKSWQAREMRTQKKNLLVEMPKQQTGNTNDRNTHRKFFKNSEKSAEITGVNVELIKRFHVILESECINSGFPIDINKFQKYAKEKKELYTKEYAWYSMPVRKSAQQEIQRIIHKKDLKSGYKYRFNEQVTHNFRPTHCKFTCSYKNYSWHNYFGVTTFDPLDYENITLWRRVADDVTDGTRTGERGGRTTLETVDGKTEQIRGLPSKTPRTPRKNCDGDNKYRYTLLICLASLAAFRWSERAKQCDKFPVTQSWFETRSEIGSKIDTKLLHHSSSELDWRSSELIRECADIYKGLRASEATSGDDSVSEVCGLRTSLHGVMHAGSYVHGRSVPTDHWTTYKILWTRFNEDEGLLASVFAHSPTTHGSDDRRQLRICFVHDSELSLVDSGITRLGQPYTKPRADTMKNWSYHAPDLPDASVDRSLRTPQDRAGILPEFRSAVLSASIDTGGSSPCCSGSPDGLRNLRPTHFGAQSPRLVTDRERRSFEFHGKMYKSNLVGTFPIKQNSHFFDSARLGTEPASIRRGQSMRLLLRLKRSGLTGWAQHIDGGFLSSHCSLVVRMASMCIVQVPNTPWYACNQCIDTRSSLVGGRSVEMWQRRNRGQSHTLTGRPGQGGGNGRSQTNGLVRHDSHLRKSGVTRPRIEPRSSWWEAARLISEQERGERARKREGEGEKERGERENIGKRARARKKKKQERRERENIGGERHTGRGEGGGGEREREREGGWHGNSVCHGRSRQDDGPAYLHIFCALRPRNESVLRPTLAHSPLAASPTSARRSTDVQSSRRRPASTYETALRYGFCPRGRDLASCDLARACSRRAPWTQDEVDRPRWLRTTNLRVPTLNCSPANTFLLTAHANSGPLCSSRHTRICRRSCGAVDCVTLQTRWHARLQNYGRVTFLTARPRHTNKPKAHNPKRFTKANRVGSPDFLGDLPFPPPLSFRHRSIFTSITPIGSQDLAVKSRPNLFTHLPLKGWTK
ncbi:hypothetical protein PR048_024712 [Dryococelus australis]|uniref:Uncharacterized protein n=1 Tax=Dryococelus australis TaxID=614101 RepID=A0ABQ9GPE3_9NEOP|nr:hypothetical protein PR048_024712 [Dryococelus australis]